MAQMPAGGYGIALTGLPPLYMDAPATRHEMRWSVSAPVGNLELGSSTVREEEGSLVIGWGAKAAFRVSFPPHPQGSVVLGNVDESEAALIFLVWVLPLVLPLFDLEPFHGSAVARNGSATILLGASKAGKSTLSLGLVGRGYRHASDDVSAIDGDIRLWPAPPLVQLDGESSAGSVVGHPEDKNVIRVFNNATEPLEVGSIIVLDPRPGAEVGVAELPKRVALEEILRYVRTPGILEQRRRALQFKTATALANLPVSTVTFDPARGEQERTIDCVEHWMKR